MTDCPLGLECPKTPECVNDESCFNWTKAWDLYEIVIVGALPPIFVHNVRTTSTTNGTNRSTVLNKLGVGRILLFGTQANILTLNRGKT